MSVGEPHAGPDEAAHADVATARAGHVHVADAGQAVGGVGSAAVQAQQLAHFHRALGEQRRLVVVGAVDAVALAQPLQHALGEADAEGALNGIQKVRGSNPLASTFLPHHNLVAVGFFLRPSQGRRAVRTKDQGSKIGESQEFPKGSFANDSFLF